MIYPVPTIAQSAPSPTRFQAAIDKYLEGDKTNPPAKGTIEFIGSSIFARWKNVSEQMAPLPVYNRAFGGSRTADIPTTFRACASSWSDTSTRALNPTWRRSRT